MRLILMGAPGAGKGTQADILSNVLKIPTISTGNILRAAMKDGSELGKRVTDFMDAGRLVPDDIIIEIIHERLAKEDCQNGYILDGVPRTVPQAEAMEKLGIVIDYAVSMEVADETITQRMSGRRVCPDCGGSYHIMARPPKRSGLCDKCNARLHQRTDDLPETVKNRLAIYHKATKPLEDFYEARGLLRLTGEQVEVGATTEAILRVIGR
ncbi:adenylate kinase [Bengtsoniella intestinalis]|uniref:adenylate kinase n=1 Tax=Bengtsoniella intestinalis TaxID=3073143 RepID=UPI00391EF39B